MTRRFSGSWPASPIIVDASKASREDAIVGLWGTRKGQDYCRVV
jgi:hypothetical protein